jgi:hypothetical protein
LRRIIVVHARLTTLHHHIVLNPWQFLILEHLILILTYLITKRYGGIAFAFQLSGERYQRGNCRCMLIVSVSICVFITLHRQLHQSNAAPAILVRGQRG